MCHLESAPVSPVAGMLWLGHPWPRKAFNTARLHGCRLKKHIPASVGFFSPLGFLLDKRGQYTDTCTEHDLLHHQSKFAVGRPDGSLVGPHHQPSVSPRQAGHGAHRGPEALASRARGSGAPVSAGAPAGAAAALPAGGACDPAAAQRHCQPRGGPRQPVLRALQQPA